jgi:hypothetical protein
MNRGIQKCRKKNEIAFANQNKIPYDICSSMMKIMTPKTCRFSTEQKEKCISKFDYLTITKIRIDTID